MFEAIFFEVSNDSFIRQFLRGSNQVSWRFPSQVFVQTVYNLARVLQNPVSTKNFDSSQGISGLQITDGEKCSVSPPADVCRPIVCRTIFIRCFDLFGCCFSFRSVKLGFLLAPTYCYELFFAKIFVVKCFLKPKNNFFSSMFFFKLRNNKFELKMENNTK